MNCYAVVCKDTRDYLLDNEKQSYSTEGVDYDERIRRIKLKYCSIFETRYYYTKEASLRIYLDKILENGYDIEDKDHINNVLEINNLYILEITISDLNPRCTYGINGESFFYYADMPVSSIKEIKY